MNSAKAGPVFCLLASLFLTLADCGSDGGDAMDETETGPYTSNTRIVNVASDPVFGDYGRLLFPVESRYMSGDTLGTLGLTWYSHIDPDETLEIVNTLYKCAADGETVFYDIYTEEEKVADPAKRDPFYDQFEAQYELMTELGYPVRRLVLEGWSHGFGGDGDWIEEYAAWLDGIFSTN